MYNKGHPCMINGLEFNIAKHDMRSFADMDYA